MTRASASIPGGLGSSQAEGLKGCRGSDGGWLESQPPRPPLKSSQLAKDPSVSLRSPGSWSGSAVSLHRLPGDQVLDLVSSGQAAAHSPRPGTLTSARHSPCLVPREGLCSEAWKTHKKPVPWPPAIAGSQRAASLSPLTAAMVPVPARRPPRCQPLTQPQTSSHDKLSWSPRLGTPAKMRTSCSSRSPAALRHHSDLATD